MDRWQPEHKPQTDYQAARKGETPKATPKPKATADPPIFSKRIEEAPVFESMPESDDEKPARSGPNTAKLVGFCVIGLALIAILFIVGSRVMTGYSVYSAIKSHGSVPDQYVTDTNALGDALKASQAEGETLKAQLAQAQSDLAAAQANLQTTQAAAEKERATFQITKESFQSDLADRDTQITALQKDIVRAQVQLGDAARRICCIQRLDKPELTGYTLDGNKITCVATGGTPFTC